MQIKTAIENKIRATVKSGVGVEPIEVLVFGDLDSFKANYTVLMPTELDALRVAYKWRNAAKTEVKEAKNVGGWTCHIEAN